MNNLFISGYIHEPLLFYVFALYNELKHLKDIYFLTYKCSRNANLNIIYSNLNHSIMELFSSL